MILWYAAGAIFLVWNVFQSSGLDFRAVAIGALLPLVGDLLFGRMAYAHTLAAAVAALVLVMLATTGRGRRLVRRRWLGIPIGWLCGLILSGAFLHAAVFWWPFAGELGDRGLLPPFAVILLFEALGLAAAVWAWRRFGLADPARRRAFLRDGRLEPVTA